MNGNVFQQSMVKLQVPLGMGRSISVSGFTVDADDDGMVLVPAKVRPALMAHGLLDVGQNFNLAPLAPPPELTPEEKALAAKAAVAELMKQLEMANAAAAQAEQDAKEAKAAKSKSKPAGR